MRKRILLAAAVAAAVGSVAQADLTVDNNLGALAPGNYPFSGTTVGFDNGADTYSTANQTFVWDQDYVYQFTTSQPLTASVTTNDPNAAVDNDFFLLTNLTTTPNVNGLQNATALPSTPGVVEISGGWGLIPAGTYYLSVDAFRGNPANPSNPGPFNGTLSLAALSIPANTPASLGGSTSTALAAAQVKWYSFAYNGVGGFSIDTEGTTLSGTNDTELGLYDSSGALLASDDDSGTGNLSLLNAPVGLAAGTYYLAVGAFNTVFNPAFAATSTSTQTGNVVINGISIPEPTGLAALGLVASLVVRRRR